VDAIARSGLCEGTHTCGVLVDLANAKEIDMPIAAAVDAVLAERSPSRKQSRICLRALLRPNSREAIK